MIMLQSYIYEIIKNETQKLVDSQKGPLYITDRKVFDQFKNDFEETINEMVEDGLIERSANINGIPLFKIKERK